MSEDQPSRGVFITEGMRITIPAGALTVGIGPDGEPNAELKTLHVGLDLCPYWLEIALGHLEATEEASKIVEQAHEAEDDTRKGEALKLEFTSGMQAIMAGAIAMDAYYASVKEHADIPDIDELSRTWRQNGTARYKQIAELLKRAFPMSRDSFQMIRQILKQNFDFRDKAVHPPSGTQAPVRHPELGIVTEWRFVTFRHYNAKAIVGLTLSIIAQTASNPHDDKFDELREYCEGLMKRVEPLVERWEDRYEELYERK